MQKQYTDSPFLNLGIGVIMFAKEHGRLFRDLLKIKGTYAAKERADFTRYLSLMKRDPHMRGFNDRQLLNILIKVDIFTQGLALLASDEHNQTPPDRLIALLEETSQNIALGISTQNREEQPLR